MGDRADLTANHSSYDVIPLAGFLTYGMGAYQHNQKENTMPTLPAYRENVTANATDEEIASAEFKSNKRLFLPANGSNTFVAVAALAVASLFVGTLINSDSKKKSAPTNQQLDSLYMQSETAHGVSYTLKPE